MVAPEMIGVHRDRPDHSRDAQADDAPVVVWARPAAPPRLPPVHPLAPIGVFALEEHSAPGLEQVLLGREKLVAREERPPADARGRQIDATDRKSTRLNSSHGYI